MDKIQAKALFSTYTHEEFNSEIRAVLTVAEEKIAGLVENEFSDSWRESVELIFDDIYNKFDNFLYIEEDNEGDLYVNEYDEYGDSLY